MRVRLAAEADSDEMADIYAEVVTGTAISFETFPPSPQEMDRRRQACWPAYPWLVAVDDSGAVTGFAYGHPFAERAAYRYAVESSIYVDAASRHRGVGRALYGALLSILAAQGYRTVLAGIALPNPASVGFHEAMGYRQVATYRRVGWKLGAWHDVGWWQRGLGAPGSEGDPPGEVIPVHRLPASVLAAEPGAKAVE